MTFRINACGQINNLLIKNHLCYKQALCAKLWLPVIKNPGTTTIPKIQYCLIVIGKSSASYYKFLLQLSLFFSYSVVQHNYLLVSVPQGSVKIINHNKCALVDLWSILLTYFCECHPSLGKILVLY